MALENYSKSLILDSMSVNARSFMALTFEELGEMDYAFEVAKDGFNINPNNAFCNYVLGKLYNVSNNKELAVDYLTKAINLFEEKNTDLESLAQWYLERAIAYGWLNYNDLEEQDYKRCLILSGDKISQPLLDGLFYYGDFLGDNKRYSEACIQFKRLKQLKSDYTMQGYTVDQMIKIYKCN
jgi:tetratricopeptide (TPR) repeat protein